MTQSILHHAILLAALSAFPVAASAQDLCGGAGAGGQWIGGSEATSDITSTDTYLEQMALVLGGNNYVALFSVSGDTSVRIEAQGRGNGDPLIDLFDEGGTILLSDDDSGGNGASRAEVDLPPGTYCVSTASYDNAPMTAFVRVGRTEQEALTPGIQATSNDTTTEGFDGQSCSDGVALGTLNDRLFNEDTVDGAPFLTFTLTEALPVSITASNEDADPVLTLYDADENYIDENDDFDSLNSRLDLSDPLPAGDYCIGLDALSDTSLPVAVEVSIYDPEAAFAALVNRGEAAPNFDGTFEITSLGNVEGRLRHDAQAGQDATWFSIDIPEPGVILIEAISPGAEGDPWLVLYDDLGRQVALNDDNGDSYDSQLVARVNRGTYLVGLKDVSGVSGLARMVFERYIPAP